MEDTFPKDPAEFLDFGRDWSSLLNLGETIASSSWAIEGSDEGFSIEDDDFAGTITSTWARGGVEGRRYTLANTITTSEGRTFVRRIYIRINKR